MIIANLLMSLPVQEFWKLVSINEVMDRSLVSWLFWFAV